MAFFSVAFFCFILLFLILHDLAGDIIPRYQWVVRLLAGLAFFIYLSGIKVVFILASALIIWSGARLIDQISRNGKAFRKQEGLTKEEKKASKKKTQREKRIYLALIVSFNLILLFFSKYFFPITGHPVALPIGISFYTLMAVSYTVDVYGGKYEPQKNFAKVLLYLCWFPQLIQGPINRYDLIHEELYKPYTLHAPQFRYSFYLFLFGAIKKYAIADLLAPMVNHALSDDCASHPGSYVLFGAFLYAIQLYADFSGGIDMAMGISMLFGVKMNENFKQPYFSTSLAEFWRRWHITLGSWMRDYVFYPFVMLKPVSKLNKKLSQKFGDHIARSVIGGISNIFVFVLVGLWHGPEKHYIVWGLYNGMIIAVSDALAPLFFRVNKFLKINTESAGMYVFRVIRTFIIVVLKGYFDFIGPVRVGIACFVNTFLRFEAKRGAAMITSLFTEKVASIQAIVTALLATGLLFANSILKERGKQPLSSLCHIRYYYRWPICFLLMGLLLYSLAISSGIRGFMYAAF